VPGEEGDDSIEVFVRYNRLRLSNGFSRSGRIKVLVSAVNLVHKYITLGLIGFGAFTCSEDKYFPAPRDSNLRAGIFFQNFIGKAGEASGGRF
jgi:hypothetical protein